VVEQSDPTNPTGWVSLGATISPNPGGSGSVDIPNTASITLLCGRNVRLVCDNGVICGPTKVKQGFWSWLLNSPGKVVINQAMTTDSGSQLLETWDDGSIWTLSLTDRNWEADSVPVVSSAEGDLSVTLLNYTGRDLTFRIDHDASPLTANTLYVDDIKISGLSTPGTYNQIASSMRLNGTSSAYLNGSLLGTLSDDGSHACEFCIPEPSSVCLCGIAFVGGLWWRRRNS
jgi:hypothetical protein